jgi:AraC-like DNA-binding protein
MLVSRVPGLALRPFVRVLWATTGDVPGERPPRERVLPTGGTHLVFLLGPHPLRLCGDPDDGDAGAVVGHAAVGGARATFYVKEVSPTASVGAQLSPGAIPLLTGAPAEELAGRHTNLEDLWGRAARQSRERIAEAGSPEGRLDALERILSARLPHPRRLHPAVALGLERFEATDRVGDVVRESGYSRRRFGELFRAEIGLAPKVYCRLRRFQQVLWRLAASRDVPWGELALSLGYADQAHFNREFREFAGVTPGAYRRTAPRLPDHLPLPSATA